MVEWLRVDWPLKALAVVLAFGVWISITGQDRTVRDVTVPLEVEFGRERIAAIPPPTTVTVRLEGPQTTIRRLDPLRLGVRLDLDGSPTGEREVLLTANDLTGVPRGVKITRFAPDRVALVVAARQQRQIAIVPELAGQPADGFAVYGFAVRPATTNVEGPDTVVEAMERLETAPIPLERRTDSFIARVGLVPDDPLVSVVDAGEVSVEVWIAAAAEPAVLGPVPVGLPFDPGGVVEIRPEAVELIIEGPPDLLGQLETAQISAVADVAAPGPARGQRARVRVELLVAEEIKRFLKVRSVSPTHVSVRVDEKEQS